MCVIEGVILGVLHLALRPLDLLFNSKVVVLSVFYSNFVQQIARYGGKMFCFIHLASGECSV